MSRTTGQRAGLSRRQVLDAAHDLLTERGLDGLTIRSLAERLDVVPNAVYRWVDSKAALLDAVVDDTLAALDVPTGDTPVATLRNLLLAVFDAIGERPALATQYLDRRTSPGPNSTAVRERIRQLLLDAGVSRTTVATATPVLIMHTLGFAAFMQQTDGGARLLHGDGMGTPRETLGHGVDWLINGITASG